VDACYKGAYNMSLHNPTTWAEPVDEKDPRAIAICANCGCPNHLKTCGRCRKLRYCSVDCQREDWEAHKGICRPKE